MAIFQNLYVLPAQNLLSISYVSFIINEFVSVTLFSIFNSKK